MGGGARRGLALGCALLAGLLATLSVLPTGLRAEEAYQPFGETAPSGSETYTTLNATFGFAGYRRLPGVRGEFYLIGQRVYDAKLGRFLNPDPVWALDRPQTFSPYSYAQNRPTVLVDPTGEWAFLAPLLGALIKLAIGAAVGAATSVAASAISGDVKSWSDAGRAAAVGATAGAILVGMPAAVPMLGIEMSPAVAMATHYTTAAVAGGASHAVERSLAREPVTPGGVAMGAGIGMAGAAIAGPTARGLHGMFRPMPAVGNVPADRAISTMRVLGPEEEFLRWESSRLPSALTASRGLQPGTYVAPISDGLTHPTQLIRRYHLPRPDIPRDRLHYGIKAPGAWGVGPRPVSGGMGTEVYLPFGTGPNTVGYTLEASQ